MAEIPAAPLPGPGPRPSSGITAYDLGQWRLERLRELVDLEARSNDRVLRLVDHLQTARDLLERQEREIARLKSEVNLSNRARWRLFDEVLQLRKALTPAEPPPATPRPRKPKLKAKPARGGRP